MLRIRTRLTVLVLVGGLGLLVTPAARAGLIPNQVATTQQSDGSWRWTYNVVVTSDLYVAKGDYFTIYDFSGADPSKITAPAGWTVTSQNTTVIPPKYGHVTAADDPNIPNYTFTYTGSTPIFGSAGIGNFSFVTPFGGRTDSVFTSVNHRQDNSTKDPDPQEFNLTPTVVPVGSAGQSTPEPATLVLAAAALPLVGLLRRRRV
jgi:hypothetical protein